MMAQNHFLQRKAKKNYTIDLFVVFRPTRELFTSYGDVTIAGEGVQIFLVLWFFSVPHLL